MNSIDYKERHRYVNELLNWINIDALTKRYNDASSRALLDEDQAIERDGFEYALSKFVDVFEDYVNHPNRAQ